MNGFLLKASMLVAADATMNIAQNANGDVAVRSVQTRYCWYLQYHQPADHDQWPDLPHRQSGTGFY